ncbi:hypothetical protein ACOMHN_033598 [Nucella lapillus]
MPRRRATRTTKHTKPKKPENDIGNDLDPEERRLKLRMFLNDFETEVNQRLQKIEAEKKRLQSIIEKELNMQLNCLPVEIRNMKIMDYVAAGGTEEAALMSLRKTREDSLMGSDSETTHGIHLTSEKGRRIRKGKGTSVKANLAPPSSVFRLRRSRFQTPATRQLPAVWDTPAVTPKFDVKLPFTPGVARGPRHEERLMSLAGSPVDISSMQRTMKTLKHAPCIPVVEDDLDSAASRVAGIVPHISKTDITRFLSTFSKAKNH